MISERAMLAAVHISIWTAVKHDGKSAATLPINTARTRAQVGTTNNCSAVRKS